MPSQKYKPGIKSLIDHIDVSKTIKLDAMTKSQLLELRRLEKLQHWTPVETNWVKRLADEELTMYKANNDLASSKVSKVMAKHIDEMRSGLSQAARNVGYNPETGISTFPFDKLNKDIQGGNALVKGITEAGSRNFSSMAVRIMAAGVVGGGYAYTGGGLYETAAVAGAASMMMGPRATSYVASALRRAHPDVIKDIARNMGRKVPMHKPMTDFFILKILTQANKDLSRSATQAAMIQERARQNQESK